MGQKSRKQNSSGKSRTARRNRMYVSIMLSASERERESACDDRLAAHFRCARGLICVECRLSSQGPPAQWARVPVAQTTDLVWIEDRISVRPVTPDRASDRYEHNGFRFRVCSPRVAHWQAGLASSVSAVLASKFPAVRGTSGGDCSKRASVKGAHHAHRAVATCGSASAL